MKTSFKRVAAWMLAMLMILSCMSALAAEESVKEVGATVNVGDQIMPLAVSDSTKITRKEENSGWGGTTYTFTVPIYFYTSNGDIVATIKRDISNGRYLYLYDANLAEYLPSNSYEITGGAKVATGALVDGTPVYQLYNARGELKSAQYFGDTIPYDGRAVYVLVEAVSTDITVTFNANHGSGTVPEPITITQAGEITLPSGNGLSRSGYEFMGWGDAPQSDNGTLDTTYRSKAFYASGAKYYAASNITLYAVWALRNQDARYFVRLDGQIPTEPGSYNASAYTDDNAAMHGTVLYDTFYADTVNGVNSHLGTIPGTTAIRNACNAKVGSIYFTDGTKYETCNTDTEFENSYYVLWYVVKQEPIHVDGVLLKKSLFNVTYNPNCTVWNGTVPLGQQYAKDATVTVARSDITRTGYTFLGWSEDPNATGPQYVADDTFIMPAHNVNLYAVWQPNNTAYKVEYYYSESEGEDDTLVFPDAPGYTENLTGRTGETVTVSNEKIQSHEKNGYEYVKYQDEVLSGDVLADGSLVLKVYYKYTGGTRKTIPVRKNWVGKAPEADTEVTIQLKANEVDTNTTLQLTVENDWHDSFANLPTFDRNGNEITYTVDEVDVAGYTKAVAWDETTNGYIVTNTYTPQDRNITVTKEWAGDTANAYGLRDNVEITLNGYVDGQTAPVVTETATIAKDAESSNATFEVYDYTVDGKPITYKVYESSVPAGYTSSATLENPANVDDTGKVTITNTMETVKVTVKKLVTGEFGDRSKKFEFTASATIASGTTSKNVTLVEDKHNLANNEQWEITVPKGTILTISETPDGYDAYYQIGEGTRLPGPSATVTANAEETVTFTNAKIGTPDTGVVLDSLPYIVILAVVVLGVVLMVRKRRHEDD